MSGENIRDILEKIAQKNGVSAEEVCRDIEFAIQAARENPSPQTQAYWNAIPRKGEVHTVEDVIACLATAVIIMEGLGS